MLAGEKKLFKTDQVKIINIPHYDELSCSGVSKLVRSDPVVQKYFKDEWVEEKQHVNREFFFNVINTLYPDYLPNLIKHASKQRFSAHEKPEAEETILCTEDWAKELAEHPYYSK